MFARLLASPALALATLAAELLPTRLRATGLGVPVAIGRVGAMLAPLLLTWACQATCAPSSALLVLILLALPGPIAALFRWVWGE